VLTSKKLVATTLALAALAMTQLDSPSALAKKSPAKTPPPSGRDQLVAKSPAFKKATANYQQGKYLDAIKQLEYIDSHGGCCQWVHYYLGLCYQGINQVGLSYRHFQWVLSYGKDGSLRKYSQYASDTLTYYAANRSYAGQGGIAGAVAESRTSGGGGGGGGGSFG
jgi:hypothetical protein